MGTGIQICGLNGCGKSTLGKALADELGFHFIDNEGLFFARSKEDEPYSNPRSRQEVEWLLMEEVCTTPDFVFAAVRGDYGEEICRRYDYVVAIEAPKEVRLQRVRNRSFQKFGKRMLAGGDLYEQEEAFFQMAGARADDYVENWLRTLKCPVFRVNGEEPVVDNVERIVRWITRET